jgi:PAS domain S-box-containing protein
MAPGEPHVHHDDQAARLAALTSYDILDTPAEPGFDDIVFIASQVCATPIALVSLVDQHRQWFKARVGLEACETPISQSVCAHGLSGAGPLIIPDLTLDPRTRANTLVTEEPRLRFYAGAPLISPQGQAIGMLCVIDTVARPQGLDAAQIRTLEGLARQVVVQLELRKAMTALERDSSALRREAESERAAGEVLRERSVRDEMAQAAGQIGTFEVDIAADILRISPEGCRIFGVAWQPLFAPAAFEALVQRVGDDAASSTRATRADGSAVLDIEYRITRPSDGAVRWVSRRGRFVRDAAGTTTHMMGTIQDVTERRVLNQEISHRLTNTLTLVQAIAGYTLGGVEDQTPVQTFHARVQALSTAHELLLERGHAEASMGSVLRSVLDNLGQGDRVRLHGEPLVLGAQAALNFAMLVHELATNACKYGALSVPEGRVLAGWQPDREDPEMLVFEWRERGGPAAAEPTRKGFGSRLLKRGLLGRGDAELRYGAEGLTATMCAPRTALQAN